MSARNSRPCSRAHAAATYATDHCTTLRRRSLVQMLWSSRSAGVSFTRRPPCRGSVAASDPVAGVIALEASGITASARRNPAAAVAGSERESASWESGNLGSCRAFADSPGCQDSRFSVPRPGGDLGGRDRRAGERAGGRRPGELETWNLGIRAQHRSRPALVEPDELLQRVTRSNDRGTSARLASGPGSRKQGCHNEAG